MTQMPPQKIAKYQRQLLDQDSLFHEIRTKLKNDDVSLRFGKPWVAASNLAQQYYCEKKVEMQFLHGEVDTESKQIGTEAHDSLVAKSQKVTRDTLFREIYTQELVIAQELLLISRYNDVILIGKPDAIVFYRSQPLLVIEYKFSDSSIPYQNYHVQAHVYCTILEDMNFDTHQLFYAIAIVPPALRNDQELFDKILVAVSQCGPKEAEFTVGQAHIYTYQYRPETAKRALDWALQYWQKVRDALPTTNINKCKTCEYQNECLGPL